MCGGCFGLGVFFREDGDDVVSIDEQRPLRLLPGRVRGDREPRHVESETLLLLLLLLCVSVCILFICVLLSVFECVFFCVHFFLGVIVLIVCFVCYLGVFGVLCVLFGCFGVFWGCFLLFFFSGVFLLFCFCLRGGMLPLGSVRTVPLEFFRVFVFLL